MPNERRNPLQGFHPLVARWFTERLGTPTGAQARGWEEIRAGRDTLIAAPTGSGKTLAAFLAALDALFREGLDRALPDEVRVVYVSPLKALSADIHRNLAEPRREIRRLAEEAGLPAVRIHAAVRTGDTPQSERAAMLRKPPHILVTTPESLYLLLTAERSRAMLATARTVIVDEIHAVLESRRGSHLALSLERLDHAAGRPLQRIGLSATQKPISVVGEFLVGLGSGEAGDSGREPEDAESRHRRGPSIIDTGHVRALDLGLEVPGSPLEAVMAGEVWAEVYDRLAVLIAEHRTTLVFVNTRRLAERVARHLAERLGEDAVMAHHGSLAKEVRLEAEERLKEGKLRVLVATASLELGIDVGHVELVCQLGSPRRIAAFLQRVGRSGHTVRGTPKGRIFPLSRDDLIECTALLRAVHAAELDRAIIPDKPLDVLAQQIVAEVACEEWSEDDLFALVRRAWPYRDLERPAFDDVVQMLARGFATRRGRRAALIHHDAVNRKLRARKGSRMTAINSGGAIPELADYRVVLEPEGVFIGTLNEDFAIESSAGDVFQLGNASWRILRVLPGVVRVADAHGEPPTIPFWLGEAPARSEELSRAVASLRAEVERRLPVLSGNGSHAPEDSKPPSRSEPEAGGIGRAAPEAGGIRTPEAGGIGTPDSQAGGQRSPRTPSPSPSPSPNPSPSPEDARNASQWLIEDAGLPTSAAEQIVAYLGETKRLLGALPTQETIILERFFDEAGGMQLVLHAPFGARINRAWGLALRKKFCRTFNFELQAAATDDGLLLSLGPQHSFPLADVFRFLQPSTLKETLVQAVLDSPLFQTRWRWNTTLSLAVLRSRNGKKVPPQLQRMQAEDALAAVFPDAAACFENIEGDREVPDHPLVNQTLRDCLEEAMDLAGLEALIVRILGGSLTLVARDTPEPSPLCHELLNARPYAFLDDAPLEERRTQAVYTRRALDPSTAADLGALDEEAIRRVRREAWPDADSADELHDALLTCGFLRTDELSSAWRGWLDALAADGRATRLAAHSDAVLWVAAERLPELRAVHAAPATPEIAVPALYERPWTRDDAVRELLRGRLEVVGPTTAAALAAALAVREAEVDIALAALEAEGVVLRGTFSPGGTGARDERSAASGRLRSDAESLERRAGARDERSAASGRLRSGAESPGRRAGARDERSAASGRLRSGAESLERRAYTEWCDRRLLARIHRYTLNRLRAEIQPVAPSEFMRFLFHWQHVEPDERVAGLEGLAAVVAQLDGFEIGAGAWEASALPVRVRDYAPELLDMLCLSGRIGWGRLAARGGTNGTAAGPLRTSPVALFLRPNARHWLELAVRERPPLSGYAAQLLESLEQHGASFFHELVTASGLLPTQAEQALAELVASGLVTADSFAGMRALLTPSQKRAPLGHGYERRRRRTSAYSVETAGRWSALPVRLATDPPETPSSRAPSDAVHAQAVALLRRWGVVYRRLLEREACTASWRELALVYRRMEARGEIRGGRFVSGFAGEQFALPEAVGRLRSVRKLPPSGRLLTISAADPLNLTGLITPEARVPALANNRVLYRDGVPVAALEAKALRRLAAADEYGDDVLLAALTQRPGRARATEVVGLPRRPAAKQLTRAGSGYARPAP
jgi:ATP-dependent Lhr-like helicase